MCRKMSTLVCFFWIQHHLHQVFASRSLSNKRDDTCIHEKTHNGMLYFGSLTYLGQYNKYIRC